MQNITYEEIRTQRKQTFKDTINIVNEGKYITSNNKLIVLDQNKDSIIKSELYSEYFNVEEYPKIYDETNIEVYNDDCLVVAKQLLDQGYNPAILNMANRQNPGGGVTNGAGAQEENIFRRSNLFLSLYQFAPYANIYGLTKNKKQYPLDRNFGGVYSPDVTVFRGLEKDKYPLLENPFKVSFISVAAINNPILNADNKMNEICTEATKHKMRTILRIALKHAHDSIVLGAMGCGAFRNPPDQIARLFKDVIHETEFDKKFKLISFAIIEDHNSHLSHNPNGNYSSFIKVFQ